MAGIEKLKEKILEEARLAAGHTIRIANEEADRTVAAAIEEANHKKTEIIEKAQREAAERRNRVLGAAELESRKMKLQAKQEVIEEAFSKALERLENLSTDEYIDVLVGLIAVLAEKGDYEVVLSEKDKSKIGVELITKANLALKNKGMDSVVRLSSGNQPVKNGFILVQGDIEVNSSFEAVLKTQREELEGDVVKALF